MYIQYLDAYIYVYIYTYIYITVYIYIYVAQLYEHIQYTVTNSNDYILEHVIDPILWKIIIMNLK